MLGASQASHNRPYQKNIMKTKTLELLESNTYLLTELSTS
jgi:hypothetical protein